MESVLSSARVPLAKKETANGILDSIGATTSDLINSAYDYLLEKGELPRADAHRDAERTAEGFKAFVGASTLDVDWGAGAADGDYKRLIKQGKLADYESLA